MSKQIFTVVIEKRKDGYHAYCPQFEYCKVSGETYEQSIQAIREQIRQETEKGVSSIDLEAINIAAVEVEV